MSENGVMDRPRRTTRSSLASSTGVSPGTPTNSSNPYKKPTYFSNSRDDAPSSSRTPNGTPTSSTRGRRGRGRGRPPGRNSTARGGQAQHIKPECIAVRVDGRRSTGGSTASSGGGKRGGASGGRRSTYTSRHDYEYHYGSDFESDHDSEPEDELESEQDDSDADSVSLPERNEDAESDSDFSVSSTRTSSRLPSPPVPIWLDTEKVPEIPKLELPTSSDDLLLSKENVVKAVEIYEPLRRFHQLVRISPFRFEDFCAALASDDQSSLLAEIHIQLLKSVIREEDANGTLFGPNEVKDSVQAVVHFIDHITWPESLRSFLESDPSWADVHDAIVSVEYPFCEPEVRIKVLGLLVDQFLTTSLVREQLLGDGNIMHEDHCRACNRLGELICCETCPAVYHLECITPPIKDYDNPPDDWKCQICMKHQIAGVNDCFSEVEKMGLLIRHERLGYDRHGRKYWFLVRRVLVESEDGTEVWYYSTRKQLEDLLSPLDADDFESLLVSNIKSMEDEIYRQMEVTEEVTRQQNTHRRKTYLEDVSGKENEGADGPERVTRLKSTGLYKLGQEGLFRTYVNYFASDPAALSKGRQNEERDRKRHMSHKFSLTTASECKYLIKDIIGCSRSVQVTALKNALTHMESVLPTTLMHVNWPVLRKSWLQSVQAGYYPVDFSQAMIMISSCIRNAVYNPVWSESTGHVRFQRMSLMEREEKKKAEKRDKKDKDDEEDRLKSVPQFIKYTLPIRHQVYKQKGEEYRLHGRWGWLWLSNMRRCKSQDCRETGLLAGPHKHVIQVKNEMGKVKTMLIDPSVYSKLMAKRSMAVSSTVTSATSSSPPKSPSNDNTPAEPSTPDGSSSDKEASSSEMTKQDSCNEVEMKEKIPQESEEKLEVSLEDIKHENTPVVVEDEIQSKEVIENANAEKEIELKVEVEPMEVDNDKEMDQNVEADKDNAMNENGTVEQLKPSIEEGLDKREVDEIECQGPNPEHQESQIKEKEDQAMEVDKPASPVPKPQTDNENENEKPISVPEENPVVNGSVEPGQTEESSDAEKENKNFDAETNVQPASPVPSKGSDILETDPATSQHEAPLPVNPPIGPAAVSEKAGADDAQGRKFRTELVNVSSGLISTHRILYPKVAKRCDYLDSLLQRKLTLKSLEEKTLKSEYGEEMVLKAKKGITDFEEEEKKREKEADELPGEEVLDHNLTLGGAYAFCCYSSECRKEALLFLESKGKNRERLYEKICYSPMCRLKFCLQETIRIKQEKMREYEKEKYYKVYKEIEAKRMYTAEGTSQKVYMKKLPDCVLAVLNGTGTVPNPSSPTKGDNKKKKTPAIKYPQVSSFQYSISKKPSILVPPQFELKKLSRTAGRMFTPSGFFQNQKSGSWGWSLPCGRPVFRTAWQYKTTHARTLGAAALQLRILYASIKWDDILAKIPNTEGKHQVHTDTEIITTEILQHRIVGRFMERVQYLRKMMVVPIDAPKTIREITPSRIGLRKRKRAESPDKMEPVVSEDWVDEERLELWEIRYYGDRIDRRNDKRSDGVLSNPNATPSASTRTKSGIAIKQPEKYDPSLPSPSTEKKSYPAHTQQQIQKEGQTIVASSSGTSSTMAASGPTQTSISDTLDRTIDQVIRNHNANATRLDDGLKQDNRPSAVNAAELMRETIATEMKLQRSIHVSKRDKHSNINGNRPAAAPISQPTASQQFQQQLQQNSAKGFSLNVGNPLQKNVAQVASTPATSKVGGVVVAKKFFANRQANVMNNTSGLDTGLLTKRPMQNTITINKGAGGSISIVKNPVPQPQTTQPSNVSQQQQQVSSTPVAVSSANVPVASNNPAATVTIGGQQQQITTSQSPQKLSLVRLADGRLQVRGLMPGQHCFQTADGRIHVSMAPTTLQQAQAAVQAALSTNQVPTTGLEQQVPVSEGGLSSSPMVSTNVNQPPVTSIAASSSHVQTQQQVTNVVSINSGMPVQQQQVIVSSQQQPIINISNQTMKTNISSIPTSVQSPQTNNKPMQQQQVIVQQQNGQQIILQGAAAQAVLQQQQNIAKGMTLNVGNPHMLQRTVGQTPTQLLQQRASLQSPGNSIQAKNSAVSSSSPNVVASSSSPSTSTSQQIPGRIVIQDGKAIVIPGHGLAVRTAGDQHGSVIVDKQTIQSSTSGSQTIVRPQIVQTTQRQLVQSQGGLQLIQSGQQLHIIQQGPSNQNGQQFVIQQPQPPKTDPCQTTVSSQATTTTPTTGDNFTASSGSVTSTASMTPGTSSLTTTTPSSATTTPVKHMLSEGQGRSVLLTQSQLNELTSGRQIMVNKQLVQLPTSTQSAMRPQQSQQVLQTFASSASQPTIQIFQGPGGQKFLIQPQSAAGAQSVLQQGQQQVQIMMPSGGQFGGGQPILVKKFMKPTSSQGSPTAQMNKGGHVVQIPTTAQNQLAQLLGPNKALVRLENNQLAAIQLPVQQTSSSGATTVSTPPSSTTTTVVHQVIASKSPAPAASQPSTTTPQSAQNQTTITRTPGLPISIVSPSKSKAQQGNQQKSPGIVQVISSSPVVGSNQAQSTSASIPGGGMVATQVQMSPKTPTVVRVANPTIVRGGISTPTTFMRSPTPGMPSPRPLTPNSSQQQKFSHSPVRTPIFATKSAPPQLPLTPQSQPQISTSPVVQQQSGSAPSASVSVASSVITATKSFPAPIHKEDCIPQTVLSTSPAALPTSVATAKPPVVSAVTAPKPALVSSTAAPISVASVHTPVVATKTKPPPSKIVAQIFQTAQGPKVIIQGVSPGDLSQTQMLQLQQQIHKTLAAQQQQQQAQKTPPSSPTKPLAGNASATPSAGTGIQSLSLHSAPASTAAGTQQNSLSQQSPLLSSTASSLTNAQQSSPIEVLRSVQTPVSLPSPMSSPIMARSPPFPSMVSPAKILSPPSHMASMLSASKSSSLSGRVEPSVPGIASPPVIVARKSAPRKSPIKTNNLDSPPRILSPPPPPAPVIHNSRGMNSVAAELMQPLNSEQQQMLADKRNALKEEIMEKKKAAATQMRLDAQREVHEALEKAKANELAQAKAAEAASKTVITPHQNNAVKEAGGGSATGHFGGRGKKRKMKTNSRNSTDGGSSAGATSNNRRTSGGAKRKRKLFCICETPYDKDKFYVGCDKCDNWFHGDCVGITEEMSKDLQEYICDDCRDDKLYCVCRKPYNDLQFYIQCDKCDDWFHGRCVGVLQGESDTIGDYCCPSCEPNSDINAPNGKQLDTTDYSAILRLVKELQANRSSIAFRKPVTKAQAPNYYSIIKEPMDLQTVTIRVEERQYGRLLDFIGDVVKIFENCRYYNDSTTDIFRQADNLEKFFVQKICALRQSFNARARQRTP